MTVSVDTFAEVIVSNTITRPANTTQYTAGDIIANSATAASVTPFTFADVCRESQVTRIERIRILKSGTSVTNANFRVHFYSGDPGVPSNGDNGAFLTSVAKWIGSADVTCDRAGTDGAIGTGLSLTNTPMTVKVGTNHILYALLEARGAYTPASGETFTIKIEAYRF